jgi:hypothetical protein
LDEQDVLGRDVREERLQHEPDRPERGRVGILSDGDLADEEGAADKKLTKLAETVINVEAVAPGAGH